MGDFASLPTASCYLASAREIIMHLTCAFLKLPKVPVDMHWERQSAAKSPIEKL